MRQDVAFAVDLDQTAPFATHRGDDFLRPPVLSVVAGEFRHCGAQKRIHGARGDCERERARVSLCDIMPHAQRLAAILGHLRDAFRHEELPPPSEGMAPPPSRPGLLDLLFAAEPLPRDPPPPPPQRGLIATVFAPEKLPLDPEPAPRRRTPWLAWLLAPEPIDDDSTGPEVH